MLNEYQDRFPIGHFEIKVNCWPTSGLDCWVKNFYGDHIHHKTCGEIMTDLDDYDDDDLLPE